VAANESAPGNTIASLLREQAARAPDATCILSAAGRALAWRDLLLQLDAVRAALRLRGIAADHRVALVMPNGPTLAVAFLAVSSASACAPLNPSYSADEFAFYLDDLKSRALIVSPDAPEVAVAAAGRLGIPVLEAVPDPAVLGLFDLSGPPCGPAAPDRETLPEDVALLLHTSGTTSRPKLVPLRQRNLIASARNMVRTLELRPADRCLNLMPLFHIHGLVGGLLAPLAAGGSAACPPPFRPDGFLRWLSAADPTWYTAVPTMHRAIATEAAGRDFVRSRLRFIRSSSAPLPAALFDELARIFRVPVVEAYSMTEAAHQMTCNPLTPGRQKPGTVGLPAGPDVALLDEDGHILPAGAVGEIAIRGPSVIDGYEANPKANAEAYADGWFRTGDQGRFDSEGYLVLTGRLKEQINRGGEKISPLEIDQVLLRHPEVAEAVAFGFRHPSLGEEIAAAVVLRPQARAGASDLHAFLRGSLAPFKRPKRILVLEQIPKGPTGKIQRRQMAKLLDMDGDRPREAAAAEPTDALEADLLALWRRALRRDDIGPDDDFFESGGDSLMALGIVLELEESTGLSLPESMLLDYPTVHRLARGLAETERLPADPLVRVQPHGNRPPIFFFDGDHSGGYYTRGLSRLLGDDQPFFSIPPHDVRTALPSFEAMADDRLALLLGANPDRPFRLAGYCNGGMVAIEVARRLVAAGRQVELVAMIDAPPLNFRPSMRLVLPMLAALAGRGCGDSHRATAADMIWRQMSNLQLYSRATYALAIAGGVWRRIRMRSLSLSLPNAALARIPESRLRDQVMARDLLHAQRYNRLFRRYVPGRLDVPVVYYSASYRRAALRALGLEAEVVPVPGGHWGCITTHAQTLVDDWRRRLDACDRARGGRAAG
jgi:acyl-CoA synthetase (AMP-forming)/AMP-acid ligase II/thioesterase domain-containing protein/acyl carrier protein